MKNFIHHSRPSTKKEIKETIKDLDKQIHYQESIGKTDKEEYNGFKYLKWQLQFWKDKLKEMEGR
jgi:hypothetical protein